MRKQKTGLQKDIATIFQDAIISEDDHQEQAEHDAHPISWEDTVGAEREPRGADMSQDESEPGEPWLVEVRPSTQFTAEQSGEEGDEAEESFFRRFLKLFTEETP